MAENKLFATLDTTSRSFHIGREQKAIISDTVGFIQLLPPQLLTAFMSTLSELSYADLLLHVIDSADPNWEEHTNTVQDILAKLSINKPTLYVFNKIDSLPEDEQLALKYRFSRYSPHVMISARSRDESQPLIDFIDTWRP